MRKLIIGLALMTALNVAHACDCTLPVNYSNPQCKGKTPTGVTIGQTNSIGIGNSAAVGNTTADAAGGSVGAVSATGGSGGAGGQGGSGGNARQGQRQNQTASSSAVNTATTTSQGGNASNAGNVQSSNSFVERSAPSVGLGVIVPPSCGGAVQGGGSNTKGSILAGFAWTSQECYTFMLAQSFASQGDMYRACLILQTTKTMDRARRKLSDLGVDMPMCNAPVTTVVTQVPGTYTQEQVDAIVKKVLRK